MGGGGVDLRWMMRVQRLCAVVCNCLGLDLWASEGSKKKNLAVVFQTASDSVGEMTLRGILNDMYRHML